MRNYGEKSNWSLLNKIRNFWLKYGFSISIMIPAVIYTLFFLLIISFYLLRLSFTYQPSLVEQYFPSVRNFLDLAMSKDFRLSLFRTIIFVLVGTPLQLVAGLVLALLINREFFGRGFIRSVFLLPVAIPALATASTIAFMLFTYPGGHINDLLTGKLFLHRIVGHPINWYTSPFYALGLALFGKVWRDMPISMLILLAGLQTISDEQYEAARTMGANGWKRFWFITIPMIVPAISTVLILRSIEVWKEFIFPFIIAPTFPILGVMIDHEYHVLRNPPMAATIGVLLIIFILITRWILTFITEKVRSYLVKG